MLLALYTYYVIRFMVSQSHFIMPIVVRIKARSLLNFWHCRGTIVLRAYSWVGNQSQSTGSHRCSTQVPPVCLRGGICSFCGDHVRDHFDHIGGTIDVHWCTASGKRCFVLYRLFFQDALRAGSEWNLGSFWVWEDYASGHHLLPQTHSTQVPPGPGARQRESHLAFLLQGYIGIRATGKVPVSKHPLVETGTV